MNLGELLALVESVTHTLPKKSGDGYVCRCPAHDDNSPSLSITESTDGKILLNCHAGCTLAAITVALGIKSADLFPKDKQQKSEIIATYPYPDSEGKLQFEVCRYEPKDFRQRRPDPDKPGKWLWNLKGIDPVPYRLPELIKAVKTGETMFIVEGEKDVAALVKNGLCATCNAGGAGKWRESFANYFNGAKNCLHHRG